MKEAIKELITADPADKWGCAMGAFFALADVLTAADESVPYEWEYRPGLGAETAESVEELVAESDDWATQLLGELFEQSELSADDLRHAGRVLHRYTALLARAGKSY